MKNFKMIFAFSFFTLFATAQQLVSNAAAVPNPPPATLEVNDTFGQQMANTFAPLEKNRVPHGLLLDLSMEFTNVPAFNGTLDNGNIVENKTKIFDCYQDSS